MSSCPVPSGSPKLRINDWMFCSKTSTQSIDVLASVFRGLWICPPSNKSFLRNPMDLITCGPAFFPQNHQIPHRRVGCLNQKSPARSSMSSSLLSGSPKFLIKTTCFFPKSSTLSRWSFSLFWTSKTCDHCLYVSPREWIRPQDEGLQMRCCSPDGCCCVFFLPGFQNAQGISDVLFQKGPRDKKPGELEYVLLRSFFWVIQDIETSFQKLISTCSCPPVFFQNSQTKLLCLVPRIDRASP
jgi:hypothetical protein